MDAVKFYESGLDQGPVILLLPGTCCHYSMFKEVSACLRPDFHVVAASYDGFDEHEDTLYPDMTVETERIEAFLMERFGGHIACAYGCSLGGSFAAYLVQRGRVRIDHAIIGSSDMDEAGPLAAWLQGKLMGVVMTGAVQRGGFSGLLGRVMTRRLQKQPPEQRAYLERFMGLFFGNPYRPGQPARRSIENQFVSDLTTRLQPGIAAEGTVIHVFYATKMGEKYEARYRKFFADPDIRRHDLNHEELLAMYPEQWASEVRACCGVARSISQAQEVPYEIHP